MDALRKVYQYAEPNLTLIGWTGFLGFPLYYVIWEFVFPQPYENLLLRLFCSLLFLGMVYRERLCHKWYKYAHLYYQLIIIICLPFFFCYMLLMNDWSHIWGMSFMAAIFLHILLVHITWLMLVQAVLGISFAIFFSWVAKDYFWDIAVDWAQLPVFFFGYLFGSLYFYRYQVDSDSKVTLAKSFGAAIAHEMRNPFSSLSASIHIIQSALPDVKANKKAHYYLKQEEATQLHKMSSDAIKIIDSATETINLLLTSIDENEVSRTTFKKYSAQAVVENAIASFSYKNKIDQTAVLLDVQSDFEFFGSDLLLKYVIYNLFKNAFNHRSIKDFYITVTLKAEQGINKIVVRDTGSGISEEVMENIFKDFYTTDKIKGHGLGLPFCKKVMHAFGGDIQCQSQPDHWTEFSMTFPLFDSDSVREIKSELMKYKSVLFVSNQKELISKITEAEHQMGFRLTTLSVAAVLEKTGCKLDYDLVVVDVESFKPGCIQLDRFEALCSVSEAQFIYLYRDYPMHRYTKAGFNPVWLETESWLLNQASTIEGLLFDTIHISSVAVARPLVAELKHTVMIVDDNESLRKYTAILLEKQGYEVIQKENGPQAIEALNTETVDLILMDIEMPLMDGLETADHIRKSNEKFAEIPIIAHTGDNSAATLNKIGASNISDYLVKPADKNKLLDKIADWI